VANVNAKNRVWYFVGNFRSTLYTWLRCIYTPWVNKTRHL